MPVKFVYFDCRGLGEAIRYLLIDNGVAFEEELVELTKEGFASFQTNMKPNLLYGQLPVLHLEDGTALSQSNTILRHLARAHGLYGSSDHERDLIDQLMDGQDDERKKYLTMVYQNYEAGKEDYIKRLDAALEPFEKQLKANNEGQGFVVGSKISFADYKLFDLLDNLLILHSTGLDKKPLLKAYHARIAARPKLQEYRLTEAFAKRPVNGNGKQ